MRVKGENSLTFVSAQRLAEKEKKLSAVYGDDGKSFYLDLLDTQAVIGVRKNSLKELLDDTIEAIKKSEV